MVPERLEAGFLNSLLVTIFFAAVIGAQEFRGSISGQVTDPSGAAVAGAQVTATNVATNTSSSTATNPAGNYTVLYLTAGQYRVSVEVAGFKKLVREGIEIRVGDQLKLDLSLEVGRRQETVEVTAAAPLLQTSTASAGEIYDAKLLSDLPIPDGNPLILPRFAPGVSYVGPDLKYTRPFDNSNTSALHANGGLSFNEFTLDGSPDTANGNVVAFVPPRDAVKELKVHSATFDAQMGHTANAVLQMTTKDGTNALHGTVYEFVRNDILNANDFFLNKEGVPKAPVRYNLWGATVGGPIVLPEIYNGRDRTFFFFAYEGITDKFPSPAYTSIPTAAERNGDFSALLPLGVQIYDPLTATLTPDGHIQRVPFLNNIISPADRISPIAKNYLAFLAPPNLPGDEFGRDNFFDPQSLNDYFNSETVRIDRTISDKQKAFFRYTRNHRRQQNYSNMVRGFVPGYVFRLNNAGTFDDVYSLSPTMVLNYRLGFSRYQEGATPDGAGQIDPAKLGFPMQTVALFGGARYLPNIGTNFFSLGTDAGGVTAHNIYSFQTTVSKIPGSARHQLKFGYEFRAYRENDLEPGCLAGCYGFGTDYTVGPRDDSPSAPIGQDFAALLLGIPSSGSIDRNASYADQTTYHALFIHDDWKVTSKLTLNLGLRYEYEGATTERFNRNTRGLDLTTSSPIAAAAEAAYAANPIPQVAPADFHVRGGVLFATPQHRGFWDAEKDIFMPRLGIVYHLTENSVIRGGWGIYTEPFVIDAINQPGFSQSTNLVPTLNGGLTFVADFANPFPNGLISPPGSSLGLATDLGQGVSFWYLNRKRTRAQRWEVSFQRQLSSQTLFEAAFVGNYNYHLPFGFNLDDVPARYLSTSPVRDQATIDLLTQQVANPFQNLTPNTDLNGSTVPLYQLLTPFPQFTGMGTERYNATSFYKAAQFKLEKRFSKGYELLANYTLSQGIQDDTLNDQDTTYIRHLSGDDHTHAFKVVGVWELPFGQGRSLGSTWKGLRQATLGGWQAEGTYVIQSGGPVFFGTDYIFNGDPNSVALPRSQRNVDHWFNTSGFNQNPDQQYDWHLRTVPYTFPGLRGQVLNQANLSAIKVFTLRESVKLQARFEFLNAFNHPQFRNLSTDPTSSSFSMYRGESNLPRNIQFGLKLIF